MAKSRTAIQAEAQTRRLYIIVEALTRMFCAFCATAKVVLPFIFIYLCAKSFAGQSTHVDMALKAITDFKADKGFAYLFGGGGVAWGYAERKMRKKKTAALADRNANLEKQLDSRRSSSGLPPTGETRREDNNL